MRRKRSNSGVVSEEESHDDTHRDPATNPNSSEEIRTSIRWLKYRFVIHEQWASLLAVRAKALQS